MEGKFELYGKTITIVLAGNNPISKEVDAIVQGAWKEPDTSGQSRTRMDYDDQLRDQNQQNRSEIDHLFDVDAPPSFLNRIPSGSFNGMTVLTVKVPDYDSARFPEDDLIASYEKCFNVADQKRWCSIQLTPFGVLSGYTITDAANIALKFFSRYGGTVKNIRYVVVDGRTWCDWVQVFGGEFLSDKQNTSALPRRSSSIRSSLLPSSAASTLGLQPKSSTSAQTLSSTTNTTHPVRLITVDKQSDNISVKFGLNNSSLIILMKPGDISKEKCDALVNPTGPTMEPDGGADQAIHQVAAQFYTVQVRIAVERQGGRCPPGQSRIFTSDTKCPVPFIINTVGPLYSRDQAQEASAQLRSCYESSLGLANIYGLKSISYSAISCGNNRFPPQLAAKIAFECVQKFAGNVKDIRFVLYDTKVLEVFIREWTTLADEANRAHVSSPNSPSALALPVTSKSVVASVQNTSTSSTMPSDSNQIQSNLSNTKFVYDQAYASTSSNNNTPVYRPKEPYQHADSNIEYNNQQRRLQPVLSNVTDYQVQSRPTPQQENPLNRTASSTLNSTYNARDTNQSTGQPYNYVMRDHQPLSGTRSTSAAQDNNIQSLNRTRRPLGGDMGNQQLGRDLPNHRRNNKF